MRVKRKVIAIHEITGERKEFESAYVAAKALGCSISAVQASFDRAGTVFGWKIFDTPDRIRERIKELEEQIQLLEN